MSDTKSDDDTNHLMPESRRFASFAMRLHATVVENRDTFAKTIETNDGLRLSENQRVGMSLKTTDIEQHHSDTCASCLPSPNVMNHWLK